MRRLMARLLDRLSDRFIDRLLVRAENRMLHPKRRLLLDAQADSAAYALDHMSGALVVETREELLKLAVARMPANGSVLEFGVASGESIRFIAGLADRPVHGFDSFLGLPEDWPGRHEERGHYSTGGALPPVPANVTLHAGLFDQTLPAYLDGDDRPVAFVHVDCDLYSSTKTLLDRLAARVQPGTVIVFDEYFNHINWRQNEFRAFQEFVAANGVSYSYLCWGYQQAAVIIDGMGD